MRRLLVKYAKLGDASFLSHRETMRALERALRRAGLPLAFSGGFSPRPRMTFSPALPLGVAAEREYLEVAVDEGVDEIAASQRMNEALPEGLRVLELRLLPDTMPKLSRWARYGMFRVRDESGECHIILKHFGEGQGRLKDALRSLEVMRGEPRGRLEVTRVGLYASPEEVFEDATGEIFFYEGMSGELKGLLEGDEAKW